MNLKNIMDTFTKHSLLSEYMNLYPKENNHYTGYDYIIDILKSKNLVETSAIIHIDMSMEGGKDSYDVYAMNDQERINLSFIPWETLISMEIEPDILEYMDEKVVFAHCLYTIATANLTPQTMIDASLDVDDSINDMTLNPEKMFCFVVDIDDFCDEFNKTIEQMIIEEISFTNIGEFNTESDKIIICDVNNTNDRIVLQNAKIGTWHAAAVYLNEDGENECIELTIKHDSIKDQDIYILSTGQKIEEHDMTLNLPSKKVLSMDFSHYDELEVYNSNEIMPKTIDYGVMCEGGKSEGPYTLYKYFDADNQLIAIRVMLSNGEEIEDEDFF